ncbi:hypothetical protein VTK73DRAFT_4621 [Phialemonium thermophilum]|uniref:Uncharacterized protein n=1 Tax=Phialemonium thermophilum TaxID=223376 RepID=A0ABR3V7C1_9PEZI
MAQSRDWNRAYIWRSQVLHQMEKLPPDHPGRKVRVTKVPPLGQETKKTDEKQVQKKEVEEKQVEKDAEKAGKAPEPTPKLDASAPSSHPPEANTNTLVTDEQLRCRSAFYQTASSANVTLFVKNADPQKLNVHFGPKEVSGSPSPVAGCPSPRPCRRG